MEIVEVFFQEDDLSITIPTEKMDYRPVSTTYTLTDGTYTLTDGAYTLTASHTDDQNIYAINFLPDDNFVTFEEEE